MALKPVIAGFVNVPAGGAPSGSAGGDLSGTYPNPTVLSIANVTNGVIGASNGGTGLSSLGSGVATFLGTPNSANLASAVTDENGSGKLIFAAGTLAITSGKTLTSSNTLTLSGIDGSTLNLGAGGTLGTNAFTSTSYVPQTTTVNGQALSGNVAINFPNKVWVDSVSGSDSTGALSREDLPYKTISAAYTAAISATGNWLCYVMPSPVSTVTITIATPGVVTWTAHGLVNGQPIVLTTTGALPTGLSASTVYYVVNRATNTFQLSATSGGSAINTSGTQSGTHTASTFYYDTGLVPHGNNYNIATVWMPDAIWYAASSSSLYDLTGITSDKRLYILGHGRFYGSNSNTGQMINSTYSTTAIASFIIEADRIEAANAGGIITLRGTFDSTDPVNSSVYANRNEINVGTLACANSAFAYFRIGGTGAAPFVFVKANYIGGVSIDQGNFVVDAGYAEAFKLGPNDFGTDCALLLHCTYRFKGTGQPALVARAGVAIIDSPNWEVTDGAASCLQIPANADTSLLQISVRNGRFKQWAGGSSSCIDFAANNANFQVRLFNCEFLIANSATNCITSSAGGAQTIEAIGGITGNTTNVVDAHITVRGSSVTSNTSLWTGF